MLLKNVCDKQTNNQSCVYSHCFVRFSYTSSNVNYILPQIILYIHVDSSKIMVLLFNKNVKIIL